MKMELSRIEKALAICYPKKHDCDAKNFIAFKPCDGIIPRCHYIDSQHRDSNKAGAIIIGQNPGNIRWIEQEAVKDAYVAQNTHKLSNIQRQLLYGAWKSVYEKDFKLYQYYSPIVELLKRLNIKGNILWTDLYKCEHKPNRDGENDATIDKCVKNHLWKELQDFHKTPNISCPIILLGKSTYVHFMRLIENEIKKKSNISKIVSSHQIVGLPHPSRGHLVDFMVYEKNIKELKKNLKYGKNKEFENFGYLEKKWSDKII